MVIKKRSNLILECLDWINCLVRQNLDQDDLEQSLAFCCCIWFLSGSRKCLWPSQTFHRKPDANTTLAWHVMLTLILFAHHSYSTGCENWHLDMDSCSLLQMAFDFWYTLDCRTHRLREDDGSPVLEHVAVQESITSGLKDETWPVFTHMGVLTACCTSKLWGTVGDLNTAYSYTLVRKGSWHRLSPMFIIIGYSSCWHQTHHMYFPDTWTTKAIKTKERGTTPMSISDLSNSPWSWVCVSISKCALTSSTSWCRLPSYPGPYRSLQCDASDCIERKRFHVPMVLCCRFQMMSTHINTPIVLMNLTPFFCTISQYNLALTLAHGTLGT